MILYVCPECGNYLVSLGILEVLGSLGTPPGRYVCTCKCGVPMYCVQPGDRIAVQRMDIALDVGFALATPMTRELASLKGVSPVMPLAGESERAGRKQVRRMILYICLQDGRYVIMSGLLEAFLRPLVGSDICVCEKCGTPMYHVQPGDRLSIKRAGESTAMMIEEEVEGKRDIS